MAHPNEFNDKITALWEDFQHARAYQSSIGLTRKIPMYVRFYEGDQWPPVTKNTQGLPRPVVNIVKMICRNKKSAILSTPVKIKYEAEDERVDTERFNRFSEYIQKEIGQDALDKKAIDAAVKKGCYFYHYYWDAEESGKKGNRIGALRCELIDPLNIFFADPTQEDEQKQAWIMIASRETVASVREKCDSGVDLESIVSDESDDPYSIQEQEGSELVTVLTRYFRKDGEVYIEKATKNTIVNRPFPLTPDIEKYRAELDGKIDAPNNDLPDKTYKDKPLIPHGARARLYPIVVGNYEPRERCIYGLSEVEGLIQNQRSINFNIAMMLLAAQENGWGKYVVHKDALQGQVITNEPGQVLTDYTAGGNGIKRLTEHALPSAPMSIADSIMQMTRNVTGASEVMTGEAVGANMTGVAIAQLQSQALKPIEELKNTFWLVKEKQGKVLAQFYKLFYHKKEYSWKDEVVEQDELGNPIKRERRMTDVFFAKDFENVEFEVVVETVGGTNASVAGDISALDVALAKGAISPKTYFELYPQDALSNRSEILKKLESEEANKVAALQAQIEQLTQMLQASEARNAELQKTADRVQTIIREKQQLQTTLAQLYTEASQKITEANMVMVARDSQLKETERDARVMAEAITNQHDRTGASPSK
ncbi:MAG: hypothetical protein J6S14_12785 [Clostridia bacterium]|nr:hypothetical protein [Clostridia bacterium]